MWLDNASDIDLLFYSPYVDTIVGFVKETDLTPVTIGLYGSWGAGKSSLLNLIQNKIKEETKDVICISLNAWQFEGYEDAKVAIMESLLKSLNDNETIAEKAGTKISSLLKRINYLKLGTDLAVKGLPYVIGALTGSPIPVAVSLSASLSNSNELAEDLETIKEKYINKDKNLTQVENIRKFRKEFEDMLNDVSSIKNLVVVVDDLDRCTPERIIDSLEAIKLFLSVKKTTFIVAVDQRIIEYAVNIKYPQAEGFAISSDYIEKIIQLPIKIPELSAKDIENYLLLLICQDHLSKEMFGDLISKIYNSKIMLSDKAITCQQINDILGSIDVSLRTEIDIIVQISNTVSSSLKGNPRQAKRFLNTFFVRKQLASFYFEDEINLSIMAKLLALETIDIYAFRKLYEWSSDFNGEIKQLKEIEQCVLQGKELSNDYTLWHNQRLIRWIKSDPKKLYSKDLSKYFYLSREALSSEENLKAKFTDVEREMLEEISNCIPGQEDSIIKKLSEMAHESQHRIIEVILEHYNSGEIGLSIISRLYVAFTDCQKGIVDLLIQKDKKYFTPALIPHLKNMYVANKTQILSILEQLLKDKKIDDNYTKYIIDSKTSL